MVNVNMNMKNTSMRIQLWRDTSKDGFLEDRFSPISLQKPMARGLALGSKVASGTHLGTDRRSAQLKPWVSVGRGLRREGAFSLGLIGGQHFPGTD